MDLYQACKQDQVGRVIDLIQAGTEFEEPDEFGMTPLSYAMHNGCSTIVIVLKAIGATAFKYRPEFRLSVPHMAAGMSARATPNDVVYYRDLIYFRPSLTSKLLAAC